MALSGPTQQAALLLLLAALPASLAQSSPRTHPPSPCPRVFSYEGSKLEPDHWYGTILLSTDQPLTGVRLDVELDRPTKILGNWEGKTSTRDNVRFTILNLQRQLRPGPPHSVRVFVRFGEHDPVPRVRSIALNGRRICPEDDDDNVGGSSGGGGGGGGQAPGSSGGNRPTSRPVYPSGGGGGGGGGLVYEEPAGGRPTSSGVEPLSNEGGPPVRGPATTPPRRTDDPYGDRRPATDSDLSPDSASRRPVDRDRTTRRPAVSVLPVGGVGSGDRRPSPRPTQDPFGGGVDDRTTTRRDPFDSDRYTTRRTTRLTSALPFHNVWEDEQPVTEQTSRRPAPGQRPPDAEWITTPNRPVVTTTTRTTTESPGRRTTPTRYPSHDDGSVRCGTVDAQATPLVTNGQRTSRGQWPWHAALYQSKGIDLSYKCGGSLISRSTVVTAAHCVTARPTDRPVEADSLVVFIGKYHLKLWSEGGVQDKQVSSVYIHPTYNSSNFNADIALLILTSPVDFTTFVRPVCLWGSANTDIQSLEDTDGYVVGWGYDETGRVTEELMLSKMPVVSQQTCLWSHPQFFSHFTSNRTYCAGFRNGTSVCNGDSGGGMVFPMTTRDGARIWQLRGIVSISVSKEDQRVCDTAHYVVFTDVAKFLDWIRKYIK